MQKLSKQQQQILAYLKSADGPKTPKQTAEDLETSYQMAARHLKVLAKTGFARRELTGGGFEFHYFFVKAPRAGITVNPDGSELVQPHSAATLRTSFKRVGSVEFIKLFEGHDLFRRISTVYMNYDVMIARASSGEKITAEELKQFESELQAVVHKLQGVSLSVQRFLATEQCWDHTKVAKFFLS